MRRYWLSIVLALFGMCGIAGYYAVGASDDLPAFKLATISGDPVAAAPIRISAHYENRIKLQFAELTAKGSSFPKEGLLARPMPVWTEYPVFRKLLADHRGFMRKKTNDGSLYVDEKRIVYADVYSKPNRTTAYSIQLDVLDQVSGKTMHKDIPMSSANMNDWAVVCDVQVTGEELHILVQKSVLQPSNERRIEYVDHVLDLAGNPKHDVPLDKWNNVDAKVNFITSAGEVQASKYAGFWSEEQPPDANGNVDPRNVNHRWYAYDYETGELAQIGDVRKERTTSAGFMYENVVEDGVFYMARSENDKSVLEVARHDLTTKQTRVMNIAYKSLGGNSLQSYCIRAGRVYLLLTDTGSPKELLVALDASSGDVVYKGQITAEGDTDKALAANQDFRPVYIDYMVE